MSTFSKSMSYLTLSQSSSVSDMIKKSIKEYSVVELDRLTSQLVDMANTPVNKGAMRLLQGKGSHQIKILSSVDRKIVSMALPFATYRSGGMVITNAYLDNVGKVLGDRVTGSSSNLFALLDAAYVANNCFDTYGELTNRDIMVPLMNVYTDMVVGVFNVMVHARADKKLSDMITYGARRFFLTNMLQIDDEESVGTIAVKGLNNIDQMEYEQAVESYKEIDVDHGTLEDWLKWVSEISPKTKAVNKQIFIEKWLRNYGEYAYFAMDNAEYLVGVVFLTMASVPGFNRSLQILIKNTKTITKLNVALYNFGS